MYSNNIIHLLDELGQGAGFNDRMNLSLDDMDEIQRPITVVSQRSAAGASEQRRQLQRLADAGGPARFRPPLTETLPGGQVGGHRPVREQALVLHHGRHRAPVGGLPRPVTGPGLPVHGQATGVARREAGQQPQQAALAGAVRADQGQALPRRQLESGAQVETPALPLQVGPKAHRDTSRGPRPSP